MRSIMIFAAIMIVAGTIMAQVADRLTSAAPARAAVVTSAPPPAQAQTVGSAERIVTIPRDRRGHFQTDGRIEGQRINFMVDTGASVVALTENDAARIGMRPSRGDYNATVTTANGTVKGARIRLASIDVGGLIVRDVDALVLPDGALSENLLGLSYLSRLKRFEFANGQMVLQ